MKILVTGSSGQLARSLAERAQEWPEVDLIAVGRPGLDLEVPGSAERAIRHIMPDVIINAAAMTDVDGAEEQERRAQRINAEAAGEVAWGAAAIGAPVVQISTDYVFDGKDPSPYREDAPTAPINAYGRSKLAGEVAVRSANPDHLILRTAWFYSPYERNFVRTMLDAARTGDVLRVVDDQRGNPTSALDLADGILAAIHQWRPGTYHLAGTGSASWRELADEVMAQCRNLGLPAAEVEPIKTEDWPTRAERPRNSVLDSGEFERHFGLRLPHWRPSVGEVVRRLAGK